MTGEEPEVKELIELFREKNDSIKQIATMVALNDNMPRQNIASILSSDVKISRMFIYSFIARWKVPIICESYWF
jgi:hypothetical protein